MQQVETLALEASQLRPPKPDVASGKNKRPVSLREVLGQPFELSGREKAHLGPLLPRQAYPTAGRSSDEIRIFGRGH